MTSPHIVQSAVKPGCEPLSQQALERELVGKVAKILVEQSLPSTNLAARKMACGELPCLIACEKQTAGRGRYERVWLSEPGQSLTFTLAFSLECPTAAGLSLAIAVGIAECLESFGCPVGLKWPNDLLAADGGKLGGILIETVGHPAIALVGIGLNLRPFPKLRKELPSARWIFSEPTATERNKVLAALARTVLARVRLWQTDGLKSCQGAWTKRCVHATGQKISVTTPAGQELIEFAGVGDTGQLLGIGANGQLREVSSGEIGDVIGN